MSAATRLSFQLHLGQLLRPQAPPQASRPKEGVPAIVLLRLWRFQLSPLSLWQIPGQARARMQHKHKHKQARHEQAHSVM